MRTHIPSSILACSIAALSLLTCGCGDQGAEDALSEGTAKLNSGDYRGAVKVLKKATRANPNSATAFCNLGMAYWRSGDPGRAAECLRKGAELSGSDVRPRELLATLYMEQNEWDKAADALRAANEIAPSARALTRLAVAELRAGSAQSAQIFLKQALTLDAQYPPALFNQAVIYRERLKRPEEAMDFYERYLAVAETGPRAEQARRALADLRAAQLDERAVEDDPLPPPPAPPPPPTAAELLDRAREAVASENFDAALVALNSARQSGPGNADVLWDLAVLYHRHLDSPAKAEAAYSAFREQFPDDTRIRERDTGESARPRDGGQKTVPPPPPDPNAKRREALRVWAEGLKRHNEGALDEAVKLYRRAFTLDSTLVSAAYNLGLVYKTKGDLVRARDAFMASLSIDPKMADARYMLAVVYRSLDERRKAILELTQLAGTDPEYAKVHLLLGIIYREQSRRDLAHQHLSRYVQLDPQNPLAEKAKEWLAELR